MAVACRSRATLVRLYRMPFERVGLWDVESLREADDG
jgi:hypothetical protein